MTGRPVIVTGAGVVSPVGIGLEAFWSGLLAPQPTGERRVYDFDPSLYFESAKESRRTDRFTQLALAAADEAIQMASIHGTSPERIGVIVGTGVGGLDSIETQVLVQAEKGPRRVSPFLVPMMMSNAAAAAVSMRYGFQGPCETIVTACATGTQSIGYAARLIGLGLCDIVIAGASEAAMTPVGMQGFINMTATSSDGISRPFDQDRNGFVMSEAAGILVLEAEETARVRGATTLGRVLGSGSTADAHHITAPSPGGSGAIRCMLAALLDAGLTPGDVAHINAHGTGTPLNDAAEAAAVHALFQASVPVTSTKGVTGHALGAAGAIEAIAALLTIQHALIPPTDGLKTFDPSLDQIDVVVDAPRPWQPGPTLSNSFGFGGHNATLVVGPA